MAISRFICAISSASVIGRGALGFRAELRQRLQAGEIRLRHGRAAADVDLAGLEGGGAGALIGDEADHDAVEIGLARVPIIRIALQNDVAALHPFLEHERPGADGRAGILVRQRIGALIDMLRHDRRFRGASAVNR